MRDDDRSTVRPDRVRKIGVLEAFVVLGFMIRALRLYSIWAEVAAEILASSNSYILDTVLDFKS